MKIHDCKKLKDSEFWFEDLSYRDGISLCADTHEGCWTSYDVNYCPMCGEKVK